MPARVSACCMSPFAIGNYRCTRQIVPLDMVVSRQRSAENGQAGFHVLPLESSVLSVGQHRASIVPDSGPSTGRRMTLPYSLSIQNCPLLSTDRLSTDMRGSGVVGVTPDRTCLGQRFYSHPHSYTRPNNSPYDVR